MTYPLIGENGGWEKILVLPTENTLLKNLKENQGKQMLSLNSGENKRTHEPKTEAKGDSDLQ